MKTKLKALVKVAVEACFEEGILSRVPVPDYVIEIPNNPNHGDFATNLPLILSASQKRPPREIASFIIDHLKDNGGLLENAEVAGPGFINFRVSAETWYCVLSDIVRLRERYGRSEVGNHRKVMIEFVSANPTGPLHLGHGRGAALGDTLSRVFSFCGYDVAREFYINDAGLQVRLLGESIFSRFKQMTVQDYAFPQSGYHGDYISDLAETISREIDLDEMSEEAAAEICAQKGKVRMLEEIKQDLENFRVSFDLWYSESDLYGSGQLQKALDMMEGGENLYEKDGALWIGTSKFGDDKDRVIRKKDGQFTYFATDMSYHLNKRARGFEKAINVWGADHHGYIPRMKAALSAYGFPEDWLSVVLIQLVKLWRGGLEIKMSKRAGSYVTLQELVNEVGVDAARFVFLSKNHDSPLDFDIDLVKKQDSENPVYYVQYAHARICSIFRKAASEGISLPDETDEFPDRLVLDEELTLIKHMAAFPSLTEDICKCLEPHRLTYYLTELAALFHQYFNLGTKIPDHRIVSPDLILSRARLRLVDAVRIVIANGLGLLGINAPERM
ncbi:MAG: arginine--tRNA ligase [Desulfatiglandaceae bacterium]